MPVVFCTDDAMLLKIWNDSTDKTKKYIKKLNRTFIQKRNCNNIVTNVKSCVEHRHIFNYVMINN